MGCSFAISFNYIPYTLSGDDVARHGRHKGNAARRVAAGGAFGDGLGGLLGAEKHRQVLNTPAAKLPAHDLCQGAAAACGFGDVAKAQPLRVKAVAGAKARNQADFAGLALLCNVQLRGNGINGVNNVIGLPVVEPCTVSGR